MFVHMYICKVYYISVYMYVCVYFSGKICESRCVYIDILMVISVDYVKIGTSKISSTFT